MNVFIVVLTCASGLIFEKKRQISWVVVDLLYLKLMIFRLMMTYFGRLRMHQIAPFSSKISGDPTSTSVNQHHYRVTYASGM